MISERLRTLARDAPERPAIDDGVRVVSFGGLLQAASDFARLVDEGAMVVSLLPGGVDFTAAHLGTMMAGAVFAPVSPESTPRELERVFALVRPTCLVLSQPGLQAARSALGDHQAPRVIAPREGGFSVSADATPGGSSMLPHDTAMVQFTSGSTGHPKGVLLSRQSVEAGITQNAAFLERWRGKAVFAPMPQFHAMGGALVLEHVLSGASVHIAQAGMPGADRKRMAEAAVGALVANPSYVRILARVGAFKKLPALEAIGMGSAACESTLLEMIRKQRPDVSFHLRYGLSESFGALTRLDVLPPSDLPPPGLVGPTLAGVELAPLSDRPEDAREVRVRAGANGTGILKSPDEWVPLVASDGFLATGDVGFSTPAGLHLRGRESQFIKRNGYRVDPGEIEQALVADASVNEACVIGVPDALAGARIVAVYEGDADSEYLDKHCRTELSAYKVPQKFIRLSHLPRTKSGKPDRARVRAEVMSLEERSPR